MSYVKYCQSLIKFLISALSLYVLWNQVLNLILQDKKIRDHVPKAESYKILPYMETLNL